MNLEQLKKEWEKTKKAVLDYFKNNGISIKYDIDTDLATAYDKDNLAICSCYLYEEDIIDKLFESRPQLHTKDINNLLDKLNETFYILTKLEKNKQIDLEK